MQRAIGTFGNLLPISFFSCGHKVFDNTHSEKLGALKERTGEERSVKDTSYEVYWL